MTNEVGQTDEGDANRITKRDFIRAVARRAGVQIKTTEAVYEALLVEVLGQVRQGVQVNLVGYGRFYPQVHKGHAAQFGAAGRGRLPDYTVLKFSATKNVNNFLALSDTEVAKSRVPGTTLYLDGRGPSEDGSE